MSKLLYVVALIALVAILACGGEDATEAPAAAPDPTSTTAPTAMPEPTATPEPTPVPEPTAMPEPTAAREPTEAPTEAPAPPATPDEPMQATEPGQLTALRLDDPVSVASELSESELACLAGTAETGRLLELFASPDLASPEEQTQLIGCLEDETLLRMFLTGFIGDIGPLSVETSDCVRSGMEGVDLRSVMLAGSTGDEETAMVGGMSALFLTVVCLNDEEFAVAGPALGMSPSDRDSQMCAIEKLGGPEGLAALLQSEDEAVFMSLFGAAMECGVQMGGPGG